MINYCSFMIGWQIGSFSRPSPFLWSASPSFGGLGTLSSTCWSISHLLRPIFGSWTDTSLVLWRSSALHLSQRKNAGSFPLAVGLSLLSQGSKLLPIFPSTIFPQPQVQIWTAGRCLNYWLHSSLHSKSFRRIPQGCDGRAFTLEAPSGSQKRGRKDRGIVKDVWRFPLLLCSALRSTCSRRLLWEKVASILQN